MHKLTQIARAKHGLVSSKNFFIKEIGVKFEIEVKKRMQYIAKH